MALSTVDTAVAHCTCMVLRQAAASLRPAPWGTFLAKNGENPQIFTHFFRSCAYTVLWKRRKLASSVDTDGSRLCFLPVVPVFGCHASADSHRSVPQSEGLRKPRWDDGECCVDSRSPRRA